MPVVHPDTSVPLLNRFALLLCLTEYAGFSSEYYFPDLIQYLLLPLSISTSTRYNFTFNAGPPVCDSYCTAALIMTVSRRSSLQSKVNSGGEQFDSSSLKNDVILQPKQCGAEASRKPTASILQKIPSVLLACQCFKPKRATQSLAPADTAASAGVALAVPNKHQRRQVRERM